MKTTPLAAALAALLALAPPASAAPPGPPGAWGGRYVEGEVLVKVRERAIARKEAVVAAHGHRVLRSSLHPAWAHVKVRAGESVEEALAAYGADPEVELAQPNYVYRMSATAPNDPRYQSGFLWGFKNTGQYVFPDYVQEGGSLYGANPGTLGADMNLESAWDHVTDCSSVVVAVVDTGVNYAHQDLAANMWDGSARGFPNSGWDFVDDDADPIDRNGHGTHVAGIIGARGNDFLGTVGVCWRASLMAVRALDAAGQGETAGIVAAVNFAVDQGAKVINMSLGGGPSEPDTDALFAEAIAGAQEAGVVVVTAAGNEAANVETTPMYPCSFPHPNVICVAALDQKYQLATFSNIGAASVDVGAPGTNILAPWAGTSGQFTPSMTSGWTRTSTTGGGWAHRNLSTSGGSLASLVDPYTYPSGTYAPSTVDRAYTTFITSGADAVVAEFVFGANVIDGDWLQVAQRAAGGDPFVDPPIAEITNVATWPNLYLAAFDISSCASPSCSFGVQLVSGSATPKARGAAIALLTIKTLDLNFTSYNTIHGTSMATPAVAGLAAMLRAFNPDYTAVDVVEAIKAAGRPVAALAGKTTSGRAVDAMATLAHIRPPSNVTAAVH